MYADSQQDDGFHLSFHNYANKYKRLAYENFPLSLLFSWDENEDEGITRLDNKEDCRKLALWKASKKFQKCFDLNRSYRENKGDPDKMEEDIFKMFWHFYREEYPNEYSMRMNPQKFEKSCRSNINNIRAQIYHKRREEDRAIRLRGAVKRYEKEEEYRSKIGDEEFNRRMKQEKLEKHKKGSNSDEKYLAFILWRKNELKNEKSIYFKDSSESKNVFYKFYNTDYNTASKKQTSFFMKEEFSECLSFFLNKKDCNIWIEINEGGFGNISTKHAWLDKGFFSIDGATREKTVSGNVTYYAFHPVKGLLTSIDKTSTNMRILFPVEHRMFQEYTDLENGEYLGIPKNCHNRCHILRTTNGNIRFKVSTKQLSFMISNYNLPDCVTKTKNDVISLVENDGMETIEERLKKSIHDRHESNRHNGLKVQEALTKKVDSKVKEKSLNQLTTIVSLFEKGLLTQEEFSAAKKKLLEV